mmetsp:Transcript_13081/g.29024  ORF Transcript_13081/g.29024 Transcript_13081/m.29024 type:complete len:569 (-) Transcript_13081:14-1720(-)
MRCGLLLGLACADMYDVVVNSRVAPTNCKSGCAKWSNLAGDGCKRSQGDVDKKWTKGKAPGSSGRNCAMPGKDPGTYGDWCYCRNSNSTDWGYCLASNEIVPEQINLQMAGPTTMTVNFVTFATSGEPPVAQLSESPTLDSPKEYTGVTHSYVETGSQKRKYHMHFVKLPRLKERTKYYYRVAAATEGVWSDTYSFTSLYTGDETRVAIFGDMGVYQYNNMGNMLGDIENGMIDAVVHLGDHAYNIAEEDGRRGDGYMNAYQQLLTQVPWIPVIGNHEYYEGDMFQRFLNMSEGVLPGSDGSDARGASALHALLTASTVYGRVQKRKHHPEVNGAHSATSRFYAEDLGLIHFAAIDFSPYYFADTEAKWKAPQLKWLEADLAAVDRTKTPWVVLMGHYPLYCSSITLGAEHEDGSGSSEELGTFKGCTGTGEGTVEESRADLEPLMLKYGVDMFIAGHEHNYESIWPVAKGKVVSKSFTNPAAPVHFVAGAGGAPALDKFGDSGPWDRKRVSEWSYGRLVAKNATTLIYTQVLNSNGSVADEVVVTRTKHEPYWETLAALYPEAQQIV